MKTGYCSRREADKLVASGVVTVNGMVAEMGTKVGLEDLVLVNGKPLKKDSKQCVYSL